MNKKLSRIFKKAKHTILAPDYFKELSKDTSEMEHILADMLNVGTMWLKAQRNKDPKVFQEIVAEYAEKLNWKKEDIRRFQKLTECQRRYIDYGWARFHFENQDTEWARADTLSYNEDTNEIEMGWFEPRKKKEENILISTGGKVSKKQIS